jgi:hypothetical protein
MTKGKLEPSPLNTRYHSFCSRRGEAVALAEASLASARLLDWRQTSNREEAVGSRFLPL